jgi:hypothetical protein
MIITFHVAQRTLFETRLEEMRLSTPPALSVPDCVGPD